MTNLLKPDLSTLREIQNAVGSATHKTPMWRSETFSRLVGCQVYLKAELFQKTGSYKPRGMYWALKSLTTEQKKRGALTFSAGNAAQGLAYAGSVLGVPCTVVMPETASPIKVAATRSYGGNVIQHGSPLECFEFARNLSEESGMKFISSYDDYNLMLGHSSLGMEILDDAPDVDAIFLGIGGGGMAGGIALAMEATGHGARLFGVEPEGAPAMNESLRLDEPVSLKSVSTIADGLAAPTAGEQCFELVKKRFETVMLVSDTDIVDTMKMLMARAKLFVEPAGAAALAGLLKTDHEFRRDDVVVCIISGGNMDLARLKEFL